MEIKIGVQNSGRELVLESTQSPDEVSDAVSAAIKAGGTLALSDEKGRRVVVPVSALAYVEIGEPTVRKVGFGNA
ncbi:MAG: DUF3107 domain-containing protein [Actinomycetes bacterium]